MIREIVNRTGKSDVSDAQSLSQAPTSRKVSGPHTLRVPKPLGVLQQNNLLPKQTPSPKNKTRKVRQEDATSKLRTKGKPHHVVEADTNKSCEQKSTKTHHETTRQPSPAWVLSSSSKSLLKLIHTFLTCEQLIDASRFKSLTFNSLKDGQLLTKILQVADGEKHVQPYDLGLQASGKPGKYKGRRHTIGDASGIPSVPAYDENCPRSDPDLKDIYENLKSKLRDTASFNLLMLQFEQTHKTTSFSTNQLKADNDLLFLLLEMMLVYVVLYSPNRQRYVSVIMNELDITTQNQIKQILEKYHENEYDDDASSIGESLENSIGSLEASQSDLSISSPFKNTNSSKISIVNKHLTVGGGCGHQICTPSPISVSGSSGNFSRSRGDTSRKTLPPKSTLRQRRARQAVQAETPSLSDLSDDSMFDSPSVTVRKEMRRSNNFSGEIESYKVQVSALKAEITALKTKSTKSTRIERENSALKDELEFLQKDLVRVSEECLQYKDKYEDLHKQMHEQALSNVDTISSIEMQFSNTIKELKQKNKSLNAQIHEMTKRDDYLRKINDELEELRNMKGDYNKVTSQFARCKKKLEAFQDVRAEMKRMKIALDEANAKIEDYDNVATREKMQRKEIDKLRKNVVNSELRNANLERLIEKKEDILAELQAKINVTATTTIKDAKKWLLQRKDTQGIPQTNLNGNNGNMGTHTPKLESSNPFIFSPFQKSPGCDEAPLEAEMLTPEDFSSKQTRDEKPICDEEKCGTPVIESFLHNQETPLSDKVIRRVSSLMNEDSVAADNCGSMMISTQISHLRRRDEVVHNQEVEALRVELSVEQEKCKELTAQLSVVKEMNEQYIEQLENYTKVTSDYNMLKAKFIKLESEHVAEHTAKESMSTTLAVQLEKAQQYEEEITTLKAELLKSEENLNVQQDALESAWKDKFEVAKLKYDQTLSKLKKQHAIEMDMIRTSSQTGMQNLRDEIQTIKASSTSTNNNIDSLLQKLEEKNHEIDKLNTSIFEMSKNHASEIEKITLGYKNRIADASKLSDSTIDSMREKICSEYESKLKNLNMKLNQKELLVLEKQKSLQKERSLVQSVREELQDNILELQRSHETQIEQYTSIINQNEKQVKNLHTQIHVQKAAFIEEKDVLLQNHNQQLQSLREQHEVDVKTLRELYDQELTNNREKHRADIELLNKNNRAKILSMKNEFQSNLNNTLKERLQLVTETHRVEQNSLEQRHEDELRSLKIRYDDEIISTRNNLISEHKAYLDAVNIKQADVARVKNLKHTEIVSKLNAHIEHLKQELSRLNEKHELEMGMEIKARKEEALSHVEKLTHFRNLTCTKTNSSRIEHAKHVSELQEKNEKAKKILRAKVI